MRTLRQLVALESTYQTLSSSIDVDLLNPTTSIIGDIYNAIGLIIQLTHDSVQQFRTQLIQPFTDTYKKKVDFFVRRIVDHANAFLAHHASSSSSESFADADVNASATTFCRYFVKFWTWFQKDFDDSYKAWTYFDRKICTEDLLNSCKEFLNGEETDKQKIPEQTKVWLKCMTEFREFLGDVNSWLKTLATLNSSLPLQISSDDTVLLKLKTSVQHLRDTTDEFRLHIMTKVWTNWGRLLFCLLFVRFCLKARKERPS